MNLDESEWIKLLQEAKSQGLTPDEVREILDQLKGDKK